MLRFYALGNVGVELTDGADPLTLSRKGSALLVYLAYERRQHSREMLAALLWSDSPQQQAMTSLRTALSMMPEALKPILEVGRYSVELRRDLPIWMDALALKEAAQLVQQEWSQTKLVSAAAAEQFEAALGLYNGDFLAGLSLPSSLSFYEWVCAQRDLIKQVVVSAGACVIAHLEQSEAYPQGIALAEQILRIDPLNETTHRHLMRLLTLSGQRPQAITHYVTLQARLRRELGVEPDSNTKLVYAQISQEAAPDPSEAPERHVAIPSPSTGFIERAELAAVLSKLNQHDCRLLTIVGFGGVGKTRLAIEAAARAVAHFRDGVYFVPATEIDDDRLIPSLILDALKVTPSGRTEIKVQLLDYLSDKNMLLVLDSIEHLLDGVMQIKEIIDAAPQIKVLVTSREQLNLSYEWLMPIEGLAFADEEQDGAPEPFAATQLFVQAARRINPRFPVNDHLSTIHTITRLLEGHPLGIELTASWLSIMTPDEIAEQFRQTLTDPPTLLPGAPTGQQSLKATFNHSWHLLSPDECWALMRLAVFQGTFDLTASERIAKATLAVIAGLITKSWVRAESSGFYSFHELIRRFIYEKLVESGEEVEAHQQHLAYYQALAREAKQSFYTAQEAALLERLDAELPNLRAALSWAAKMRQSGSILEIVVHLERFWMLRGYVAEARKQIVDALIGYEQQDELRLQALVLADALAISQGSFNQLEQMRHEILEGASALNLYDVQSRILSNLSLVAFREGKFSEALDYAERSVELAARHNLKGQLHETLYQIVGRGQMPQEATSIKSLYLRVLELSVRYGLSLDLHAALYRVASCSMPADAASEEAKTTYRQLLYLATHEDDQSLALFGYFGLAEAALEDGDHQEAQRCYDHCLELAQRTQAPLSIAMSYAGLSKLLLNRGDFETAHQHIMKSVELIERLGVKPMYFHIMELRAQIELALGNLETARQCYQTCIQHIEYVDVLTVARLFEAIGELAVARNDPQEVANLLDAAATLYETQGISSFQHHEHQFRNMTSRDGG